MELRRPRPSSSIRPGSTRRPPRCRQRQASLARRAARLRADPQRNQGARQTGPAGRGERDRGRRALRGQRVLRHGAAEVLGLRPRHRQQGAHRRAGQARRTPEGSVGPEHRPEPRLHRRPVSGAAMALAVGCKAPDVFAGIGAIAGPSVGSAQCSALVDASGIPPTTSPTPSLSAGRSPVAGRPTSPRRSPTSPTATWTRMAPRRSSISCLAARPTRTDSAGQHQVEPGQHRGAAGHVRCRRSRSGRAGAERPGHAADSEERTTRRACRSWWRTTWDTPGPPAPVHRTAPAGVGCGWPRPG